MSVTIPRELHERTVAQLRKEYTEEFGPLDAERLFATQQAWCNHYAQVIRFWDARVPDIQSATPSIEVICTHAITANALANMWRVIRSKGLEEAVKARV
jgi:hypothetical protein